MKTQTALKLFEQMTSKSLISKAATWPYLRELVQKAVFSTIDLIFAEHLLGSSRSEEEGAVLALLMAMSRQGHLCLPLEYEALLPILEFFSNDREERAKIAHLVLEGAKRLSSELVEETSSHLLEFPDKPLCRFGTLLYLQRSWVFETHVLYHLDRLLSTSVSPISLPESAGELTDEQREAIQRALQNPLSLITGGPGTGKTHTAGRLVQAFLSQKSDAQILLTAPTGKAAMQLEESLKIPASRKIRSGTLHSFLGIRSSCDFLQRESFLFADLIIVDECSMVDARLFAQLLSSVQKGTRLALMGDSDQLPPIDSGSFFRDLVDAAKRGHPIPCSYLKRSLRFNQQEIVQLASRINAGDENMIEELKNSKQTALSFFELSWNRDAHSLLWEKVKSLFPMPQKESFDPKALLSALSSFRILSCVRKGPFGVDLINQMIRERLVKEIKEESWCAIPILITRSDKKRGLYNGDTGVIVQKCKGSGRVDTRFSEEDFALFQGTPFRTFHPSLLPPFEYAYCLSVHKSQGSEYEKVLLLVPSNAEAFGREILYTGATRAKKTLEIAGDLETIRLALRRVSRKISGIHARLRLNDKI